MSDSKKVQEQELKKLEDEAYFELRQIIAEAMQYQDVELLDARIASWKNKYKKLLDRPSTSSKSDFKKRIEFLLNEYYSSITQYILEKLKLREEKKVKNQAKAMRELYRIIQDTNDYDLLKKKIKQWEEKYPVSGFLSMYQKRIELYTRDKNIRENAFKQEEAFSDLVDITKKYATLDELKTMTADWEKKYSINDKYSIDDFIKHQSEIKRFISDEFLISIARDDPKPDNIDKTEIDVVEEYNSSKSFSDLSVQSSSYAALLAISKSPNSINEMFKWVYKNRHIKFNDKYKELILSATYLDYSPTYLNKLKVPNMDMSKNSLSYDEYKNIGDIKRYAIISYFNLLLPPEKAISNDYFTKHIQTVYAKSERARTTSKMEDPSLAVDDMLNSGIEVSLKTPDKLINETEDTVDAPVILDENIVDTPEKTINNSISNDIPESQTQEQEPKAEAIIDLSEIEEVLNHDIENDTDINNDNINEVESVEENNHREEDIIVPYEESNPQDLEEESEVVYESSEEDNDYTFSVKEPESDFESATITSESDQEEQSLDIEIVSKTYSSSNPSHSIFEPHSREIELNQDTVVAFSPLFIAAVNNLDKQATIVDHIDSDVTEYVEKQKAQEISLSEPVKIKTDSE